MLMTLAKYQRKHLTQILLKTSRNSLNNIKYGMKISYTQHRDIQEILVVLKLQWLKKILEVVGTKHPIVKHIGDAKHITPISANNNCLFNCIWEHVILYDSQRLGKVLCNRIRKEFNLPDDSTIPISIAIKIFNKFRKALEGATPETQMPLLSILDNSTLIEYPYIGASNESTIHLVLKEEHYSVVEMKPVNKCKICGKLYREVHTCNEKQKSYYQKKI